MVPYQSGVRMSIKTKIKSSEEAIIKNPYRQKGDMELDRKDLVDVRINTIIDYIDNLESQVNNLIYELSILNEKISKKSNRKS